MLNFGEDEGIVCGRNGCAGVIAFSKVENCSCHMGHPPCGACTSTYLFCPLCDWTSDADEVTDQILYSVDLIDEFSQRIVGVYPVGCTKAEVYQMIRSADGGRFESFGDGKFEYLRSGSA